MRRPARGQGQPAHGRVERFEQPGGGRNLGARQAVEQCGFSGIGIAHQRHHRIRHALARAAVKLAPALDRRQVLLEDDDAVGDEAAVDFELAFARAADEAETAALPLQVGPGTHQPRALVFERRQLDLQPPFMGAGALAENLQDQPGAVDHLAFPGLLQIALLHRRNRGVDHRHADVLVRDDAAEILTVPEGNSVEEFQDDTRAISAWTMSSEIASARPIASSSRASGERDDAPARAAARFRTG